MLENAKILGIWGFWAFLSQLRGRTIRLEHHTMSQILQVQQTPVFWCNMHITISKYLKFATNLQPGIQAYKPVGQQIGCFPHPKYGVMTMWVRPELINVSHRFSRIPPLFRMRYKSFKFLAI